MRERINRIPGEAWTADRRGRERYRKPFDNKSLRQSRNVMLYIYIRSFSSLPPPIRPSPLEMTDSPYPAKRYIIILLERYYYRPWCYSLPNYTPRRVASIIRVIHTYILMLSIHIFYKLYRCMLYYTGR